MDFDARKQEVLKGLDRSLKGSVDAPLCDFISAVNRHADFCSTSCCSGRATVFMSSGAPNEKNKGYMTLSSHETISTEDVNVDDPSPAYSQTPALTDVELRSAVLKFEPVVIHLEARSLERLVQLLDVARRAGLKNSGAMGLGPKRYIMAFRGSSRLEAPLLVDGQRLYTVVDPLVEEVNKRFAVNQRQIDRLVAAWEAVFGHTEEPQPAAPFPLCWAPAADGGVLRRWGHCSVVLSGLVVVIGGFGGDKVLGRQKHLAIYDPATRDWSPLETPGPAQQMGSCAVKLANDRAVVYGGRSHPGHISDEVWLLTVYSKTDAVWEPLEVEGQSPAGRHRHSGLRTSRHRVVFFGGVVSPDSGSPNGVSGDLLELTLSAGKAQWSVLSNAGPRLHSAGLLENDLGELLVIGGYRQSHLGTMSTVHTFSEAGGWSTTALRPDPTFGFPASRFSFASVAYSGCLIFGGMGGRCMRDVWHLASSGAYKYLGCMPQAGMRFRVTVSMLPSGEAMVLGGGGTCFAFGSHFDAPLLTTNLQKSLRSSSMEIWLLCGDARRLKLAVSNAQDPTRRTLKRQEGFLIPLRTVSSSLHQRCELLRFGPQKTETQQRHTQVKKWQKLGDAAILAQEPDPTALTRLKKELGCHTIAVKSAKIVGELRNPGVKVLTGCPVVIHKEDGISYKFNIEEVMFCPGNLTEKKRLASAPSVPLVLDMFVGIGYFTLPMLKRNPTTRVIGCDLNPNSIRWLRESAGLNGVLDRLETLCGDSSQLGTESGPDKGALRSRCDRILMGLIPTCEVGLEAAIRCANDGCVLHVHWIGSKTAGVYKEAALIEKMFRSRLPASCSLAVLGHSTVKSYAPKIDHFVLDIRLSKP